MKIIINTGLKKYCAFWFNQLLKELKKDACMVYKFNTQATKEIKFSIKILWAYILNLNQIKLLHQETK